MTDEAAEPLPVGLLLRISSDRQGWGMGVERQEHDGRRLAGSLGWKIVDVYRDNDVSAYVPGKTRPETERALNDIRAGRIKGLVAYHPDRVFGHPRELEDLIDIVEETGAKIATVQTGSYDLSTPAGRLVARQLGAAARYEREMKAERHRRQHLQLAQQGRSSGGGNRPFGFRGRYRVRLAVALMCWLNGVPERVMLPDDGGPIYEPEAELVREAATRLLAGESMYSVLVDWENRGIRTTAGNRWTPYSFRRMLISPRIAGLREYQARDRNGKKITPTRTPDGGWSDVIGPAAWPPIIDRDTWEKLRVLLLDPSRRLTNPARKYLLTGGLIRCGLCDAPLVARPRSDKRRCYVCAKGPGFTGCGKIRTLAEPIEELVTEAVFYRTESEGFRAALSARLEKSSAPSPGADLAEIERRLDELEVDFADGVVDRRAYLVRRRRLIEQRDAAQARLARADRTGALATLVGPSGLREAWPGLSLGQRRAVLAAVIDRVVLGPAVKGRNFFDPDRVRIVWRA